MLTDVLTEQESEQLEAAREGWLVGLQQADTCLSALFPTPCDEAEAKSRTD